MKKQIWTLLALTCIAGCALAADPPKQEGSSSSSPSTTAVVKTEASGAASAKAKLMNPATLKETAPESYDAKFETTKGDFVIHVTRAWAPNGADRFYNLVKNGFYDSVKFFRVVPGFMVQFGINGDPNLSKIWREATIPDDPTKQSNKRGFVTFATAGPNTRTTQIFINFVDRNAFLDSQGFAPFGQVTQGMDVVDKINSEYGEGAPRGRGPDQGRMQAEGNAYLEKLFANLDGVKKATIVKPEAKAEARPAVKADDKK